MEGGRSLKLFLADGTPSGVITAELGGSNLVAVAASRTVLPELIRRREAKKTGIYVLVGPDPNSPDRQKVYVGEGDQIRARLASHDADARKEFFTRVVFVVAKDENLTKAHVRYLESRVIAAVRNSGRASLDNGTEPPFKGLPEPELADMERALVEIEILLPVLGFDFLRPAGSEAGAILGKLQPSLAVGSETAVFLFELGGAKAKAREAAGEFVVLAGSLASREEKPACPDAIKRRRADLIKEGALAPTGDGKLLRFTRDVAFDTPSGAARVIYGANASGPEHWHHQATGKRYREWRLEQIDSETGTTAPSGTLASSP